MRLLRFRKVFRLIFIASVLVRCAQPGTPGGGPKDTDPPQVTGSSPQSGKPNFDGNKFTIYFNEFIKLDEINQKVMISPPMKKLPDFKTKGKSLQVKFNEELKPNTTYSVYFGDAIIDLTEGNPVLNYTYIFSTGTTVDSMSIIGEVINAFDLVPAEEIFVTLYKNNNDTLPFDSLPLAVQPYYVSKTDVNGRFQLNGLANEEYLMFGLKDLNGNYFYDQPGEEIAFLDSLVWPSYMGEPDFDSIPVDSLGIDLENTDFEAIKKIQDSIRLDLLDKHYNQFTQYTLHLFDEYDTTQQLLKARLLRKNTFQFSFSQAADNVELTPLNFNADTNWFVEEFSKEKDTITWYFKNLPVDTLEMLITRNEDTLGLEFIRLDPKRKIPGLSDRQKKKKEKEKEKEYLDFKTNLSQRIIPLDGQAIITFNQPIVSYYTDSVILVIAEDSLYNPEFLFIDSLKRKIKYPLELSESMNYVIIIPDSSFTDWNNLHNKRKNIGFKTLSLRDYGILRLILRPKVQQHYILQLLSEKEVLKKEMLFSRDTTINLENVKPGKYILKLIVDDNGNGKWDSGNYTGKIQPEQVIYYPKELVVRGNWEIEEEWVIEE